MTDGQQKVAMLEQELLKADSRSHLMQLIAPVDGTVQQLAVHTVGGVVTPAQPVMMIVPHDNPLEVEAFIENKDIGFVKVNHDAEVKIETFQYTKYGTLHAKITSISHDAINDEKRGLIYSTKVKMDRATINVDGTDVNLSPGMAVSVEIKTGKRRVIEYFLNPLLQYGHESLQER
jgi:hemolysin D